MASRATIDKVKEGFLQTMADNHAFNKTSVSLLDIACGCGYASNDNKAFKAAFKELKDDGIIVKPKGGGVEMTPKGMKDHMPKPRPPPSNEEVQEKYLSLTLAMKEKDKLFPAEEKTKKIFDCLLDGEAHSKHELATLVGWTSTDNKNLKTLMKFFKEKELTEPAGKGLVKFTDKVFPNGRPDRSNNKRKAEEISEDSEDYSGDE